MIATIPNDLWIVSIFISIMSFAFLLPAVVAMWERRLIWPYEPIIEGATGSEGVKRLLRSAFVNTIGDGLESHDFEFVETCQDAKGRAYQIKYEFWVSPDRTILTLVGGGAIIGIPMQSIWLYSRLADGHYLLTVSNQNGSELDPTGITKEVLVATTNLTEVLRRHQNRLAKSKSKVLHYSSDPLKDHLEYRFRRYSSLVAKGNAKFLDDEETAWSYTIWGAVLFSLRGVTAGMRRKVWPDGDT